MTESDTFKTLVDEFHNKISQHHEDILKQIIQKITGREATIDDAKDLTKIYLPGDHLNYNLAYKGSEIGRVEFSFEGCTASVTFKPV